MATPGRLDLYDIAVHELFVFRYQVEYILWRSCASRSRIKMSRGHIRASIFKHIFDQFDIWVESLLKSEWSSHVCVPMMHRGVSFNICKTAFCLVAASESRAQHKIPNMSNMSMHTSTITRRWAGGVSRLNLAVLRDY